MIILAIIALILVASVVEFFLERRHSNEQHFVRWLGIVVSTFSLLVFSTILLNISNSNFIEAGIIFNNEALRSSISPKLSTFEINQWGILFCIIQSIVLLAGTLLCPKIPLNKVRMSRVYLLYCGTITLSLTNDLNLFLLVSILCYLILISSANRHISSFLDDGRRELRARAFNIYHTITLTCLSISLIDHLLFGNANFPFSIIGVTASSIACFSAIGLFPFHSWVVPFIGAPRSTIFLPMFTMKLALIMLFRLYSPLVKTYPNLFMFTLTFAVLGLLHASISFFGEKRLKRIPAYLYLSHMSLMILSINTLGVGGNTASLLDSTNLIISCCGLIGVCSLLSGRLGVKGILYPTGLASHFPELGICFLICTLSLVGFPGTLGFIEEEFIIEAGIEHHIFIILLITTALSLNGFSSFRLFARIFYGSRPNTSDNEIALMTREKVVLWGLMLFLLLNGFAPKVLLKILTDS